MGRIMQALYVYVHEEMGVKLIRVHIEENAPFGEATVEKDKKEINLTWNPKVNMWFVDEK
jgi:hypothetical protein